VVNSDEDVLYTKIDLQKILHMWQTKLGLSEISFAKFGLQDAFSGVLSLEVGIAIIYFAGFVIGMAYMCMWCMCVFFCDLRVMRTAIRLEPHVLSKLM
jgi:hypothetical protein